MEKRIIGFFLRTCVVLMACGYAAITANAQLTNGGFELGSGLYTNTADISQVTTAAVGWTQFNWGLRVSTNDTFAINSNAFPTARSGQYSFQCYGPFGGWDASGAYQVVTNGVSAGQTWILSGYGLNWSGDPMTNITILAQQFGLIQLVFKNAAGTTLATLDGPQLNTTNILVDTWTSCSVTGTAPAGTARVLAYAMHVGFGAGNQGSIFWDDLALVNTSITIQTNFYSATIAGGNQVCWPTTAGLSYQTQYTNSITGPVWTNLGGEIAGDGNTNCVFDASKQKFYRVIELQ